MIFVYLIVFVFYEMKALIVAGLLAILIYALFKFKSIVNSAESDTSSPAFKYLDGLEGGFNVILSSTLFIAFTYIFYLGLSYGIT
ncbi:hypothetical protein Kalk_20825 [Ketobacter alkanivorans]|uniref:Uncharacterized protein n=1 Tax=Ketobacter alkanivorans TaxID=1917421 RepID=A0A2K9LR03_9GAMM|nr:hypothetical protein Kalk_20825 [Ketobacter alkanivorans]